MSRDFLSPLLGDVHDVEIMMRTLYMMSMDHLNYLLGGIDGVEELRMGLDHLNHIHSQIPRLPLHVGGDEAGAWSTFMCISLFILRIYMTCIIDI